MSKGRAFVLSIVCLLVASCNQNAPTGTATSTADPPLSLQLLDGVVAENVPIQIGGQNIEATIFPKNLGQSALFLCYYTLPSAAEDKKACDAAINAEIDRCVANTGAEILSRKPFPATDQPTAEVIAKSPKKKSHSIRCRVICTGKQIQSLTAITPDNQDTSHAQALDKMFEEFRAK